jgi:alpha-1,2-mannosyltransferase
VKLRRKAPKKSSPKEVAFFHPFCSAGGGGERVLWKAVEALGELNDQGLLLKVIIYTVDPPKEDYLTEVLQHIKSRFSITPASSLSIEFVHLQDHSRFLGEHYTRYGHN